MIMEIEKELDISPDFTIDDIHKIREYNYEQTKSMSSNELIDYYTKKGKEAIVELGL